MHMSMDAKVLTHSPHVDSYTFDEFVEEARLFHGYAAPGLLLGGFMVARAKSLLPEGILFDAVSETAWCLPDAVQMLTPCTIGNGWLRIVDLGIYGVSLYDKYEGAGVRVAVDVSRLDDYPTIREWLLKLKPKKEQDSDRLREEIRLAAHTICSADHIQMRPEFLRHRSKGAIAVCPDCGQAYPARDGGVCLLCQGGSPYASAIPSRAARQDVVAGPSLRAVPASLAVGKTLLHDMTAISPGESKEPLFRRKQVLDVGDVCRLQRMGRNLVYVEEDCGQPNEEWAHEDEAAQLMARAMAGEGVSLAGPPKEGKVTLTAERDGMLLVDRELLQRFNSAPGVMCATRHSHVRVAKGQPLAGTRAIPLFLHRSVLDQCLDLLATRKLLRVAEIKPRKVGILVTGTEVFEGLVEDKFIPIIRKKVEAYGCTVLGSEIAPDDPTLISQAVLSMREAGAELLVTTAGLSVDPEDLTRQGLAEAGATVLHYGLPILPGAMTMLGRLGAMDIIGVPACGLFYTTTSFDLLLPRLLAGEPLDSNALAALGYGGFCLNCATCIYPRCSFGK